MDWPSGSIEHTVLQALAQLGIANPVFRGHAFLLRNRQLVGRRFCFEAVEEVWLSAEGQIKINDEEGELLRILNVGGEQDRQAA